MDPRKIYSLSFRIAWMQQLQESLPPQPTNDRECVAFLNSVYGKDPRRSVMGRTERQRRAAAKRIHRKIGSLRQVGLAQLVEEARKEGRELVAGVQEAANFGGPWSALLVYALDAPDRFLYASEPVFAGPPSVALERGCDALSTRYGIGAKGYEGDTRKT